MALNLRGVLEYGLVGGSRFELDRNIGGSAAK